MARGWHPSIHVTSDNGLFSYSVGASGFSGEDIFFSCQTGIKINSLKLPMCTYLPFASFIWQSQHGCSFTDLAPQNTFVSESCYCFLTIKLFWAICFSPPSLVTSSVDEKRITLRFSGVIRIIQRCIQGARIALLYFISSPNTGSGEGWKVGPQPLGVSSA